MRKNLMMLLAFVTLAFAASSCKSNEPEPPAARTSYKLEQKDVLGVSGTVTFVETSKSSVTIEIDLKGAPAGAIVSELRTNSAVEGGRSLVSLNPLDNTGKSSTNTTDFTYEQLLTYDGFVQVYIRGLVRNTIVAIADIGSNELTANQKSYDLKKVGDFGVTGTALFQERKNGNTLLTISVDGIIPNTSYPATINIGSVGAPGSEQDIRKKLSNVDGSTGKSYTNIRNLDDKNSTPINYSQWVKYTGYINIYQSLIDIQAPVDYSTIICQGDIGANVTQQ